MKRVDLENALNEKMLTIDISRFALYLGGKGLGVVHEMSADYSADLCYFKFPVMDENVMDRTRKLKFSSITLPWLTYFSFYIGLFFVIQCYIFKNKFYILSQHFVEYGLYFKCPVIYIIRHVVVTDIIFEDIRVY